MGFDFQVKGFWFSGFGKLRVKLKLFEDGNFKGEDREEYVMGLVMIFGKGEYVFIGKKTKLIF